MTRKAIGIAHPLRAAVLMFLAGASLLITGCKGCGGGATAGGGLSLLPKESQIVVSLNLKRMRDTKVWKSGLEFRDSNEQQKAAYQDFVKKCGLDPLLVLDAVTVGIPADVETSKQVLIVAQGSFDEAKAVACIKAFAQEKGKQLQSKTYGGKTLYFGEAKANEPMLAFTGTGTAVLGTEAWVQKHIDLAAGKGESASANSELKALVARVKTDHGIWGAGTLPQSVRDKLAQNPMAGGAKTLKTVFGSIDFATGFAVDLTAQAGSADDAASLAKMAGDALTAAKKQPMLTVLGLAPMLDGVKPEAKGADFRVTVALNQQQVDELVTKVKAIMASMGGGGGPGGPGGPPPGMPEQPPEPSK